MSDPTPTPDAPAPDLLDGVKLPDNQCVVALDEGGTGWLLARSENYRSTDVLPECSTEDNGFNRTWDNGLSVGVYLLTLRPWADQGHEGDWDAGVDVVAVKPLWTIAALRAERDGAQPVASLAAYDAGLLSEFGGGNVEWWQDYIRGELARAHEFYQSQIDSRAVTVRTFTNELGNPIKITIEGPASTSENTLTRLEAGQLLAALSEHGAHPPATGPDACADCADLVGHVTPCIVPYDPPPKATTPRAARAYDPTTQPFDEPFRHVDRPATKEPTP